MNIGQVKSTERKPASMLNIGDVAPKKFDEPYIMRVISGKVRHWINSEVKGDYWEEDFLDLEPGVLNVFEALQNGTILSFTPTPKLVIS